MLAQHLVSPTASKVAYSSLILTGVGLGAVFLLLLLFWYLGWRWMNSSTSRSPYGGGELRRGDELSYASVLHLEKFLQSLPEEWRPIFDLNDAAVCQSTGRIFPSSLNRFGVLRVNWAFLKRFHKGALYSWGSLSPRERAFFEKAFPNLDRFQTSQSSCRPHPSDVERKYVLLKPGPLYVDLQNQTLLGWVCVPHTDLEVLILRRR